MNAGRMLARLDRAMKAHKLSTTKFHEKFGLPLSSFYAIKKSMAIKPKANKRYLEAIRELEPAVEEDMVNSPPHYQRDGVECIDAMVQVYGLQRVQEYAEIASFKYQWREGLKGDSKTDKKKKIWYTRFSMGDDPRGDAHD